MSELKPMKKVIVIGCGSRGKKYARVGKETGLFEVVAVAEPIADRRNHMKEVHGLSDEMCFETWEPLLELPRMADAAIIATMDRDHLAPALAAIAKGYDLLLEKPMSYCPEECVEIERAAKAAGVKVIVCHVLRFTPFFKALKRIIKEGTLGEIVNIQHLEGVGNVHQSHSFVRGNWGNSDESSCMILQKSCHDMDILAWLLDKRCERVHSFGSLVHFCEKNAPEGAPARCIDGCPHGETCPYNAVKLYLEDKNNAWFRGASTKKIEPTDADVEQVLRTTRYGQCVYRCNNNVVDHQVVNLEFEGGVTVSFTMSAFNKGGRFIRIMGTKGELTATMSDPIIRVYEFETKKSREIPVSDMATDDTIVGGHGGGDSGIMVAFHDLLCGEKSDSVCDIEETCRNHMIAFAAEKSRVEGRVVSMSEYEF